jgi:hypothetical protein
VETLICTNLPLLLCQFDSWRHGQFDPSAVNGPF